MIPYPDLVAALTGWRTRNGLAVGPYDVLGAKAETMAEQTEPSLPAPEAIALSDELDFAPGTVPDGQLLGAADDSEILVSAGTLGADAEDVEIDTDDAPAEDFDDIHIDDVGDGEAPAPGALAGDAEAAPFEVDRSFQEIE